MTNPGCFLELDLFYLRRLNRLTSLVLSWVTENDGNDDDDDNDII